MARSQTDEVRLAEKGEAAENLWYGIRVDPVPQDTRGSVARMGAKRGYRMYVRGGKAPHA